MGGAAVGGCQQAIGQHQAPFGVSVLDLHRDAVLVGEDVTELEGVAGDQVLGAAENELHPLVEAAADGERQGAGHHGGPTHVGLHRQHVVRGLHGVATGVEGDALAHQSRHHGGVAIPGRVVVQLQQHGLALAAAAHRPDPDMAGLAQSFACGDAGGDLIATQAADQQQGGLRQAHGVDLFRATVGHLAHPAGRLDQRLQLEGIRCALLAEVQFTLPLGGIEALGESVTALQIPTLTDQAHPLDAARFESTSRTLNCAQDILLQDGGTQVDQGLLTAETEQGAFTPVGGSSLGG